jgi:hypothetical protein
MSSITTTPNSVVPTEGNGLSMEDATVKSNVKNTITITYTIDQDTYSQDIPEGKSIDTVSGVIVSVAVKDVKVPFVFTIYAITKPKTTITFESDDPKLLKASYVSIKGDDQTTNLAPKPEDKKVSFPKRVWVFDHELIVI